MCCYKYYLINFLLRFSLHVFAAFLELSTTPEVNVAKKSTIELGYEIYQLKSAQCRNQGKILKCDFHVHEYNFLFFAKCTTVCFFFFSKIRYLTHLLTLDSTFTKLYIELFWQIHLLNVKMWHFFGNFFFICHLIYNIYEENILI